MSNRKIIGVDEVGRGCLAGPVVCAAVILPDVPYPWIAEIRDSKKLSAKKRQQLSALILQHSSYAISEGSVEQIDTDNILRTTLLTMRTAVNAIFAQGDTADLVLVDGNQTIPGLGLAQEAIEGGDDIHKSIGAASIIAKVYRDNLMAELDVLYPEYGFAQHKGYGTEQHRQAIMVHGPCQIHRLTFKGVYEYVRNTNYQE
jgi:ribonuclease HII